MRILYATSEAAPYWKTGGLAEVGQSLPDTLVQRGHEVRVVMPLYRPVRDSHLELEDAGAALIPWPGGGLRARYFLHTPTRGAPALFVDQPTYFDTRHPYGAPGEDPVVVGLRYAFFCRAVVERARAWNADVVQLNDWQTGLVPLYALLDGMPAASVFTIHNLGYQGNFAPGLLGFIGIPRTYLRPENGVEFYGHASFMKAGLALADRLVTVSPTYAAEIQTPDGGAGFDGLLRFRRRVLQGILNGVDRQIWNPASDRALPERYDARTIDAKDANRTAVLRELSLSDHGPLLALVTRFAYQKGIDLLLEALSRILDMGANVAVLGNGERAYENALTAAATAHPGRIAVRLGFNDPLARRLYAGADFFLMPSRYEPCGLAQMLAQRYGTPPIVRSTGGLADTVKDSLTGFTFDDTSSDALVRALERAFHGWRGQRWNTLRRRCMALDWSWDGSAQHYEDAYRIATGAYARVEPPEPLRPHRRPHGSGQESTEQRS